MITMHSLRKPIAIAGALLLCGAAYLSLAQTPAPAKKIAFDTFKIVKTRNIFDPDRKMPVQETKRSRNEYRPQRKATSNDYVALTGVMATEDKSMAFFASSQSEYNGVKQLNGTIAGATITKISNAGIEVTRDGRRIAVAVGQTVPMDGNSAPGTPPAPGATAIPGTSVVSPTPGDPQAMGESVPLAPGQFPAPGAPGEAPPPPQPGAGPVPPPPNTNSSTPPAGNMSETMRRMMERRQKELQ